MKRYIRTELSYRELAGKRLCVVRVSTLQGSVLAWFEVEINGHRAKHPFESTHAAEAYRAGFIEGYEEKNRKNLLARVKGKNAP